MTLNAKGLPVTTKTPPMMKASTVNTIVVPNVTGANPATIVRSASASMRVLVRNIGPSLLFLAHSENELSSSGLVSGVFQLPAGQEDVFVLIPKQGLFAVSSGAGGRLCYAASEAIPTTFMES